jgi:hypothetical protein
LLAAGFNLRRKKAEKAVQPIIRISRAGRSISRLQILLGTTILHFSFFIEFCAAKFRWASRFASLASGYPLHHLRALLRTSGASVGRFGGSATIPLAKKQPANAKTRRGKYR